MTRFYIVSTMGLTLLLTALGVITMLMGRALYGDVLAFAAIDTRSSNYRVYLFDVTFRIPVPLTDLVPGTAPRFAFSPDSNFLAIALVDRSIPYKIDIMNLQNGEIIRVETESYIVGELTWSPDSTTLGYSISTGEREFYPVSQQNEGIRRISSFDGTFSFSPQRDLVVFSSVNNLAGFGDLFTLHVGDDMSSRQTIYQDHLTHDANPLWSPNGQYIAFRSTNSRGTISVNVYNVNTTESIPIYSTEDTFVYLLAWSPNSEQLAFFGLSDTGIYIINRDGSNFIHLAPADRPDTIAWSPDGTRVSFVSTRSGAEHLYMSSLNGSVQSCVTCDSGFHSVSNPFWMP